MKFAWFRRYGLFFVPSKVAGWLILAAAAAYAVYVFVDIDRRSHSVSDTLINFVFNLMLIGLVYSLIAFCTTGREAR